MPRPAISCTSGAPWHVSCDVEQVGADYLCRIHGGATHIGALALAQWRSDEAVTECLSVSGHREGGIAVHAAHALCAATRRSVCCVAGIHFEAVSAEEIEEIVQTAQALTDEAARQLVARPSPPGIR